MRNSQGEQTNKLNEMEASILSEYIVQNNGHKYTQGT